jgi:lipopolysaccharide export system protein LptA
MARGRQLNGARRRGVALAAASALAALLALPCPQAWAQAPIGGFSGLSSSDSKKPIDIESDRLEVDDKKHTAIFIGNVSVTQGDNNLKAPQLEVFYETAGQAQGAGKGEQGSKSAKPVKTASAAAPADPMSNGQIRIIHASGGKVVVTSTKDRQEATGDDAIYDVKAQQITLTGKEVVISQGLNKVKGTKLVIDLTKGTADFVNADKAPGSAAGGKPRIRAIFQQETGADGKPINPLSATKPTPSGEPKKTQPAKKAPPAKPAAAPAPAAEWQAQSR